MLPSAFCDISSSLPVIPCCSFFFVFFIPKAGFSFGRGGFSDFYRDCFFFSRFVYLAPCLIWRLSARRPIPCIKCGNASLT